MGRGSSLSSEEQAAIDAYHSVGKSNRSISVILGRSHNVINAYLKNPAQYGLKKSSGRPRVLSQRQERAIHRAVSNKDITLTQVKSDLGLTVTTKTIGNCLKRNGIIKRRKMKMGPMLLPRHKVARLAFARQHLVNQTDWSKVRCYPHEAYKLRLQVLWSDEKKFSCDGPDGRNGYWRDMRTKLRVKTRRGFGGGSVMIWACFCADGRIGIETISSRMNSNEYQGVLQRVILPFVTNSQLHFQFMQDNASCHRSRSTMSWLARNQVDTLSWPACSPDINPIENVWSLLVRKIYEGGKQYSTPGALETAILNAWNDLDPNTLRSLATSIPQRLLEIVKASGGHSGY